MGVPIVEALLTNKTFKVTILSRLESTATFPSGIEVKKVDFTSQHALVRALESQHAVICILNDLAGGVQFQLIEAAVEAGVKRFIPSEWGSSDIVASVPELENSFEERSKIIELLERKAKEATVAGKEFHWSAVNCGVFMDW